MTTKPGIRDTPALFVLVVAGLVLAGFAFLLPVESGAAPPAAPEPVSPPAQESGQEEGETDTGIPVEHAATVSNCVRCHAIDDEGRMSRISYERKTPEGWQISIRRMVMLNNVELEPDVARDIIRYLSDNHGLAPEEARPGFFEAERRIIDHVYEDEDTAVLCVQCHSMGRVITQRRTREEWELLVAMHRGYYPLVDTQGSPGFRRRGPPPPGADDRRHPMEKAIAHLAATYPLDTDEWTAWSANRRPPRLEGRWAFTGQTVFTGPMFGFVDISAVEGADAEFTTAATVVNPRLDETAQATGRATVYAGFQWRGRTTDDMIVPNTFREVLFVERDWRTMTGRFFTGAYDEIGVDVTLRRADGPLVAGVFPPALRTGAEMQELTVYGVNFPTDVEPGDIDFGPRVMVTEVVEARDDAIRLRVSVATDAAIGRRDLFVGSAARADALVVFDTVDAVRVTPEAGMARLGGVVAPKQLAKFEAIGVSNGPDGEAGTDDDLDLGPLDVTWSLEEYSAVFDDDDIEFVGELGPTGLFTPALDGPNPERRGDRNNVGDVWVVATYESPVLDRPLRGRGHLIVTVPLYLNLDGWEPGGATPPTAGGSRGGRR